MGSEIKLKEHIRQLEENLLSPEIRTSRTELKKYLLIIFLNLAVQVEFCLRKKKYQKTELALLR